jgi:hypothetical protein
MRLSLAPFLLALILAMATPALAAAAPKPILFLWEFSGWGQGPAPFGLRFVLYDDGRLIATDATLESDQDRGPTLYTKMIGADAAAAMADEVLDQLADVPHDAGGYFGMTDQGETDIQVWDRRQDKYILYRAYAHPCLGVGRDFQKSPWRAVNRRATDLRFLEVCDRLSSYPVENLHYWTPEALWIVTVKSSEAPLLTFEWPADWGPMPMPSEHPSQLLCVPITDRPSALTEQLVELSERSLSRFIESGAKIDSSHWLVLNHWEWALPGEIGLAESDPNAQPLARGTCEKN